MVGLSLGELEFIFSQGGDTMIVVIEEVIAGLDEVKEGLERAIETLEDILEEIDPDLGQANLLEYLETNILAPLVSSLEVTSDVIEVLAKEC